MQAQTHQLQSRMLRYEIGAALWCGHWDRACQLILTSNRGTLTRYGKHQTLSGNDPENEGRRVVLNVGKKSTVAHELV